MAMKRPRSAITSHSGETTPGIQHCADCHSALLELRTVYSNVVVATAKRRVTDVIDSDASSSQRFTAVSHAPACLRTQLLAMLGPARVDSELSALQERGLVRLAHAPTTGVGEQAIMFSQDLASYLEAQIQGALAQGQGGSGTIGGVHASSSACLSSSSSPSDNPPSSSATSVVQALYFFAYLANKHRGPSIAETEVTAAFAAWALAGRPRIMLRKEAMTSQGSGSTGESSAGEAGSNSRCPGLPMPLPTLLPHLLSRGLLLRRLDIRGVPSSVGAFHYGVPASGQWLEYIRAGRKEVCSKLSKTKYREMARKELSALPLRSSALPTEFHILDCIGKGLVQQVETAAGPFIRLVDTGR